MEKKGYMIKSVKDLVKVIINYPSRSGLESSTCRFSQKKAPSQFKSQKSENIRANQTMTGVVNITSPKGTIQRCLKPNQTTPHHMLYIITLITNYRIILRLI